MNPTPTPLASTAMEAAREALARINPLVRLDGDDVRVSDIFQKHFQPLLAKVEGERDECHVQFKRIMDAIGFPLKSGGYSGEEIARKFIAQFKALKMDFNYMKRRFCRHHATPGAVEPGCPECKITALRADLAAKEADTTRLDWLAKAHNAIRMQVVSCTSPTEEGTPNNLRAVIDHFMKQQATPSALASRADKGGAT